MYCQNNCCRQSACVENYNSNYYDTNNYNTCFINNQKLKYALDKANNELAYYRQKLYDCEKTCSIRRENYHDLYSGYYKQNYEQNYNNLYSEYYQTTQLPNYTEFSELANLSNETYFFIFDKKDKTYATQLYSNLNKTDALSITGINDQIKYLLKNYGFTSIDLLYGYQNNIINWYKTIFGFIGKRDNKAYIFLRGTTNTYDWITNLTVGYKNLNELNELNIDKSENKSYTGLSKFKELIAYSGFVNLYGVDRGDNDVISAGIDKFVRENPKINDYIICGHSLGGALASLASIHVRGKFKKNVRTVLFSAPRAFSYETANYYDNDLELYNKTFQYFNLYDIVHTIPFPVTDISKTFLDIQIPFLTTVRCFKHVGIQLAFNYLPEITKDFSFIPDCHTIDKIFLPIMDKWKTDVIENRKVANYKKFLDYSEILDYMYNNKETFLHSTNPLALDQRHKDYYLKNEGISNIEPLFSTKDNWIMSDTSCIVGFIGKIGTAGIIVFGIDYEKFPIDLKYTDIIGEFLSTSRFDSIPSLNDSIKNTHVIDIFKKLYFTNSCDKNMCVKSCLDNWLRRNTGINKFIIISQNAGSCFALISALYLNSIGKTIDEIYMYSPSKLGNHLFAQEYNKILGNKTYNFINLQDTYELYMPFFSGTYDYLTRSKPLSVFAHCGEVFCLDEQPASGVKFECNVGLLTSIRNPRSYKDVKTWEKVIKKSY